MAAHGSDLLAIAQGHVADYCGDAMGAVVAFAGMGYLSIDNLYKDGRILLLR